MAEWQAANKSMEKRSGVNLPDQTWRLELEHLKKRRVWRRVQAGRGDVCAGGERPSDEVWHEQGGGELNDGVLWFHEARPAARCSWTWSATSRSW